MGYNTLVTFSSGNTLAAADLNNNFANSDYLLTLLQRTGGPGGLINGYISRTVSSNNLILAVKTMAGTDPSSTDPVYVQIGTSIRTISASLSVTVTAGTDTFGLGANGCLTDQDLFGVLGWRAAGSAVFIGITRYAHGLTYADFSATATNQGYLAYSGSAPASTDEVQVIGRFNATTSGSASYNWSVPTTSVVISTPIYSTRWLNYTPTLTGFSANPTATIYKYRVNNNDVLVHVTQGANGTSNATGFTMTTPFTAATITNESWRAVAIPAVDNSASATTPGLVALSSASATMNIYKDPSAPSWTGSGGKRIGGFDLTFQVAA